MFRHFRAYIIKIIFTQGFALRCPEMVYYALSGLKNMPLENSNI